MSSSPGQARAMMDRGHYFRVLGVPADAELQEVKVAFKRLALEYHPDRNKSPEAAKTFETIIEAYNVIMSSQVIATSPQRTIHRDDVGNQYGRVTFSLMTEEKEVFYHASSPMFEREIRKRFNPDIISDIFCRVGNRWFQIDDQVHSSFSFLGLRSGNRENLIEWYKAPDGSDKWKPVRWDEFWSHVRGYASHTLERQRRNGE